MAPFKATEVFQAIHQDIQSSADSKNELMKKVPFLTIQ
jgi:hypothetical protein